LQTARTSPLAIYIGIFLLAGSILMLEIALTRVFAIMLWHHMTHMVISITMLGFGAAGSWLTVRHDDLESGLPARTLALASIAYAFSVVFAFLIATRIPIDTLKFVSDGWNFIALGTLYLTVSVPFLFGGIAIGLALTRLASDVGRLYFFDLVGSALGALLCVLLLGQIGSTATLVVAAAIGAAAGSSFAAASSREDFVRSLVSLGGTVALALGFVTGLFEWQVPFAPGKEFAAFEDQELVRIASSTAEIDVAESRRLQTAMGGDFGRAGLTRVEGRWVSQDGTAPSILYRGAAQIDAFPFLDDSQAGSAYVTFAARGGSEPNVLVIGVGGGVDVMIALAHDAEQVKAVEVNHGMVKMVTADFDDYLAGLFGPQGRGTDGRVSLHHREGRSFIRGSRDRFDIIQMSGVDSYTALSAGAYTVSESYLYTVEAVKDFYSHLEPEGYINYSRRILTYPRKPRESLRLAHIARVALEQLGVEDPASHIAVYRGHAWASIMIKRGAFSLAELEALDRYTRKQGFWGFAFDPLGRPDLERGRDSPFAIAAGTATRRFLARNQAEGVAGTSDPEKVAIALRDAVVLGGTGHLGEMKKRLDALTARFPNRDHAAALVRLSRHYAERMQTAEQAFADTRADFHVLMRGTPAARSAFVRDYQYDVSPSTDDAPFFFNYYRYGWLFKSGGVAPFDRYWPDYPVGHLILIASLVQISVFAFILILLPLRSLALRGIETPNRFRIFGYFAALGAGFMFVEIVLMQRMVLFLGHPTYAITVVLATLLAAAGLGSLLAGRFASVSHTLLGCIACAIVALVLANALFGEALFAAAGGAGFGVRVVLVIALLAPLGLVLGMPFPLGIRLLNHETPALVPWAWAVNGFLSVFSSIFCVVLAMAFGFANVLWIAAVIYAGGFTALLTRRPNSSRVRVVHSSVREENFVGRIDDSRTRDD